MASAVTVVFGANSTQFQAELARMQAMTLASARRMSAAAASGSMHGASGLIREAITIPREIVEGRGIGRVLGSMSILIQYLSAYSSGAAQAAKYGEDLAAGYERQALQANLAAIAATKKAEASAAAAYAEGLEDKMTVEAADADAAKAMTAQANAAAAQEKAVAAREAAEAESMEAVAAGEATAASLPLMAIFIGVIATLAALYGAYKIVTGVIHYFRDEQIKAAEVARATSLNFAEEASALEKLADAADKAEDALRKMNETHDDYAKRVDAAVDAQKAFYEHASKLAGLQKDSKLTQVDIDEKRGLITHDGAIKKKAEIEKQANIDANNAKTEELRKERDLFGLSEMRAAAYAKQKQAQAQAASDAINKSPEGLANLKELDRLEKIEKHNRKRADEDADAASKLPEGAAKHNLEVHAGTLNSIADFAGSQVADQKAKMKPAEIAAANAMREAQEASANSKSISDKHVQATTAWANQTKNSPSEVAAENANIDLKAQKDLSGEKQKREDAHGYSLNSQQKVGAYAATPPILVQQLAAMNKIAANTAPAHPSSNTPPGTRPPQLASKPHRDWKAGGWVG